MALVASFPKELVKSAVKGVRLHVIFFLLIVFLLLLLLMMVHLLLLVMLMISLLLMLFLKRLKLRGLLLLTHVSLGCWVRWRRGRLGHGVLCRGGSGGGHRHARGQGAQHGLELLMTEGRGGRKASGKL